MNESPQIPFETVKTDALTKPKIKSPASSGLSAEIANEYKQRKDQRKFLFACILTLVYVSLFTLLAFITCLGTKVLSCRAQLR